MKLFSQGKVGSLVVPNRVVMAPMGLGSLTDPDGRLSERGVDYYVARAKGGVGLIITGLAYTTRELETLQPSVLPRRLMTDSKMYISRFNDLADSVHDYGAKIAVQLTAGVGRVARGELLETNGAVAPSAIPCYWNPNIIARELTIDQIKRLVKSFEFAAEILRTAGIDAIELHGHEGYLLDQFKTSLWNKRTDRYGGDLDGRLRFPLEVIEAIKRGAGKDYPIIYRFGLKHYLEGGREVEEGLEIARRLETAGVAALDVDAGCYETWHWAHPPTTQPPGCMVDMAEMTKKVVNIPVMAVGRLNDPQLAESVLQNKQADFVILGRALLADPDWTNKVREKRLEDIRPCLGCHEGCFGRLVETKSLSCAVNPATGNEKALAIEPAMRSKIVLVIGGGPGGMEAARVASLRGHKVTLWEKGDALGGNLIPASSPDFKRDYRLFIDYLSTQLEKLKVNIELNKKATPDLVKKMNPETVCIATGATPIIPDIPGVEKSTVFVATDVLLGKQDVGAKVAVVGGGMVGAETALYLAQKGIKVYIVELLDAVMKDLFSANRDHYLELLTIHGVDILTETKVMAIEDNSITIADKNGQTSRKWVDNTILAVGLKSDKKLIEDLANESILDIHTLGDCVSPRKVLSAIWEGFRVARLI